MVAKRLALLVVPVVAALAVQLPGTGFAAQAEAAARTVSPAPAVVVSAITNLGGHWAQAVEKAAGGISPVSLQASVQVIAHRLHGMGIADGSVHSQGNDISVKFPAGKDEGQILDLVSEKGQLLMRPVDCIISAYTPAGSSTALSPGRSPCKLSSRQQQGYTPPNGGPHGVTPAQYDLARNTVVLPYYAGSAYDRYVLGPAEVSGPVVKTATAFLDPELGSWGVDLRFTSDGSAEFNVAAARHYKCYMSNMENPPYCSLQAMEIDGTVETAPAIEAPSFPGAATMVGSTSDPFTQQQAKDLALLLDYGPLPVRFISLRVTTTESAPAPPR